MNSAIGVALKESRVISVTNQAKSYVQNAAYCNVPIDVGEEITVPATKTVRGSVAAGMAILAAFCLKYKDERRHADVAFLNLEVSFYCENNALIHALRDTQKVYADGCDTGLGAAHEIAL